MGVVRRFFLGVFSVPVLCAQVLALVSAFSVPRIGLRSEQLLRERTSSPSTNLVNSQNLLFPASPRPQDVKMRASLGLTVARIKARDIMAQARRQARDMARQTRSQARDILPPSNMQRMGQATNPTLAPSRRGETLTSTLLPPQQQQSSPLPPLGGARRRGASKLRSRRAGVDPPSKASLPPKATTREEEATPEEVDALQRRVREILDEYCTKAPLAEQWPPGKRMKVRGVDIHYKDTGSCGRDGTRHTGNDRPTFVLLHGLSGSTASWDEIVTELAEHGRVISFDRPGFGKTERVMPPNRLPWKLCPQTLGENPYSADFAAKALFGIVDRLGIDRIVVVAHSLGAQVALRAARSRPNMIRAMVLVAPAVLNPLDTKFVKGRDPTANLFSPITNLRTRVELTAKLAALNLQLLRPGESPLEAVRNMTLNGDVEEKVQQNFHDRSITVGRPELISKYIEPLKDPLWDRGLLHFYKSLQLEVQPGKQLLQKALDVWKGPSMIIAGDDDPTVPTQSSVYVAEMMEGRLVVLESCAHIPMDEKSEVFTSAVLSFASSEEVRSAWLDDGKDAKSQRL